MCCDSAHKTLPVLTGGAYLHISKNAPDGFIELARNTMAVFASTSPSYLILQSLDLCNRYLADQYEDKLTHCINRVNELKAFIADKGFVVEASEPLKVVIDTLKSGYSGEELSSILRDYFIEVEFADPEYVVMMFTPETTDLDYSRLKQAFSSIKTKEALEKPFFSLRQPVRRCSIREAVFGWKEIVSPGEAVGRSSAAPFVSCPPAIPIVVSGEIITEEAVRLVDYYGIDSVEVLNERKPSC
jgi:arginine/lysine/ornithine decarboxylase